jgi:uncharacterized membrane protein YbaN (DUF454 family)
MRRFVRTLWLIAGTLSVLSGILGIFLPVLPTTPFMLLAAYCYSRSSPRCHHWLLNNRWFGAYVRNYREGRGMPIREKALTIAALWLTIGATAIYALSAWWSRILLLAIACAVTIHLLRIRTSRTAAPPSHTESVRVSESVEPDKA